MRVKINKMSVITYYFTTIKFFIFFNFRPINIAVLFITIHFNNSMEYSIEFKNAAEQILIALDLEIDSYDPYVYFQYNEEGATYKIYHCIEAWHTSPSTA